MPVDPDQIALPRADPQIDLIVLDLLQEGLVQPGEPDLVDLAGEFLMP
jgi:hypothetical protein